MNERSLRSLARPCVCTHVLLLLPSSKWRAVDVSGREAPAVRMIHRQLRLSQVGASASLVSRAAGPLVEHDALLRAGNGPESGDGVSQHRPLMTRKVFCGARATPVMLWLDSAQRETALLPESNQAARNSNLELYLEKEGKLRRYQEKNRFRNSESTQCCSRKTTSGLH